MAGKIETYRKEIFNFLRTVTIKFEPFAYMMGQKYMDATGITNPHDTWNPYYIHLTGRYTDEELQNPSNLIHVWTVEKEIAEDVIFDKNLAITNPKTAALYKIPNKEYFILEERYPEYTGLIRTIAYPISATIEEAIAAPNFALLGYDDSLLEEQERESIVTCLKNFLQMVKHRWWVEEYTYEDMYATTFWAMLWQLLPLVLLGQRLKNIKTPSVHSFHIWEYLTSKGLKDYRDVLTMNQSLWLYRNINYILKNEGKHSNLIILAKNLLGDAYVSLLYKDMYQNSGRLLTDLHTTPEFVSRNIETNKVDKVEQFEDINDRLYREGLEHNNTPEYVVETEEALGTHNHSVLNTKFLELKKDTIYTGDESLMTRVYLDNLIYRLFNNNLSFQLSLTEPKNGKLITAYVGDLFYFWYWCTMKSCGFEEATEVNGSVDNNGNIFTYETSDGHGIHTIQIPIHFRFPNYFVVDYALPMSQPDYNQLNQTVKMGDVSHSLDSLIALKTIVRSFEWVSKNFVNHNKFGDFANNTFKTISAINRHRGAGNKLFYHFALNKLQQSLFIHQKVMFDSFSYGSWGAFFKNNETMTEIISQYGEYGDTDQRDAYKTLSMLIFDKLFETTDAQDSSLKVRRVESIYESVVTLFKQLGSYNITYLNNNRDKFEYLKFRDPDFVTQKKDSYKQKDFFSLIIEDYQFIKKSIYHIPIKPVNIDVQFVANQKTSIINEPIEVDYGIRKHIVAKHRINSIVEPMMAQEKQVIKLNFKINCDTTSCRKVV